MLVLASSGWAESRVSQPSRSSMVREPKGGVGVRVRDLQDGRTLVVEPAEELHDLGRLGRVEIARGLIGEQKRGFVNNGAGYADQLLLTARELRGEEVFLADDAEAIKGVSDQSLTLGAGDVFVGERQVDVLGDGEVVEQVIALKDHADVAAGEVGAALAGEGLDGGAVEGELAGPGVVEHGKDVEEGGFSCAGRAGDGDELAGQDVEVDAAEQPGFGVAGLDGAIEILEVEHVGSLVGAECGVGVDGGGATRGDERGDEADGEQQSGGAEQRGGVARSHAEEERGEQAAGGEREREPEHDAEDEELAGICKDETDDV